jgi:hypothetical protein
MPYLHQTYLYQKDERALPGDLRSRKSKFMFPLPLKVVPIATPPPPHFLFSLSLLQLKGLKSIFVQEEMCFYVMSLFSYLVRW